MARDYRFLVRIAQAPVLLEFPGRRGLPGMTINKTP
jgi:hypothetical protein